MFAPGQKVVCIDDDFSNLPHALLLRYSDLPLKGVVYVIRDLVPGVSIGGDEGETVVYLVGIINEPNKHGIEPGYNAERFAPLQSDFDRLEENFGLDKPQPKRVEEKEEEFATIVEDAWRKSCDKMFWRETAPKILSL